MGENLKVETKVFFYDIYSACSIAVMGKSRKARLAVYGFMAVLTAAVIAFMLLLRNEALRANNVWIPIGILLLLGIPANLYFFWKYVKLYPHMRKQTRHPHRYFFEWDGVKVENAGDAAGDAFIPYDSVSSVINAPYMYLLFVGGHTAYLLPKRDMDKGTVARLDGLLRERVGERYWKCGNWGM